MDPSSDSEIVPELLPGLMDDERLGHGTARPLSDTERMRIQTQGVVRRFPLGAPHRLALPEGLDEAAADAGDLGSRPQPLPSPPGLAEAERYLRELEEQPRDTHPRTDDPDAQPDAEISF